MARCGAALQRSSRGNGLDANGTKSGDFRLNLYRSAWLDMAFGSVVSWHDFELSLSNLGVHLGLAAFPLRLGRDVANELVIALTRAGTNRSTRPGNTVPVPSISLSYRIN